MYTIRCTHDYNSDHIVTTNHREAVVAMVPGLVKHYTQVEVENDHRIVLWATYYVKSDPGAYPGMAANIEDIP